MSDLNRLFGERAKTKKPLCADEVIEILSTLNAFKTLSEADTTIFDPSRFDSSVFTPETFLQTFCEVFEITNDSSTFHFERVHLIVLAEVIRVVSYTELVGILPSSFEEAMRAWKAQIELENITLPPDLEL